MRGEARGRAAAARRSKQPRHAQNAACTAHSMHTLKMRSSGSGLPSAPSAGPPTMCLRCVCAGEWAAGPWQVRRFGERRGAAEPAAQPLTTAGTAQRQAQRQPGQPRALAWRQPLQLLHKHRSCERNWRQPYQPQPVTWARSMSEMSVAEKPSAWAMWSSRPRHALPPGGTPSPSSTRAVPPRPAASISLRRRGRVGGAGWVSGACCGLNGPRDGPQQLQQGF